MNIFRCWEVLRLNEAPEIILQIPDINQTYKAVDVQMEKLTAAVEQLEKDIFIEDMGEYKIKRWEQLLGIIAFDDDTLSDRRFRIQTKILERLPYSYRVVVRKLNTLAPDGMDIEINNKDVLVKLALASKKKIKDVAEMLEVTLPLNMTYEVIIMYHTYGYLSKYTYGELSKFTYGQLRESTEV